MTTSAARIRIGVLDSDAWKAWALPWKLVASESGLPSCFSTCWMAATAWPIATPGSRLNEIVTDGNWPWWLTTSGATLTTLLTSVRKRHLLAGSMS